MKHADAATALEYVSKVKLPPSSGLEATVADFDFKKAKDQALVVGSDVVSFVRGVTEERRNDIVNSSLLAQLVATKKVGKGGDVFDWYDEYFDVLGNIGWVVQAREFAKHKETATNLDAHKAILTVATALLGPGATALTVVKSTLDALKAMGEDSPFITLFNRESQHAKTARFQISLAEEEANGRFMVSLMAFALKAKANLTQVLFFRFKKSDVTIKHASGKVTINTEVLASVREPLKQKLLAFTDDFVKKLPDLKA
ncbi:MAG: hypothetical protein AB7F74_18520 [Parvibaculaceae bacterium]